MNRSERALEWGLEELHRKDADNDLSDQIFAAWVENRSERRYEPMNLVVLAAGLFVLGLVAWYSTLSDPLATTDSELVYLRGEELVQGGGTSFVAGDVLLGSGQEFDLRMRDGTWMTVEQQGLLRLGEDKTGIFVEPLAGRMTVHTEREGFRVVSNRRVLAVEKNSAVQLSIPNQETIMDPRIARTLARTSAALMLTTVLTGQASFLPEPDFDSLPTGETFVADVDMRDVVGIEDKIEALIKSLVKGEDKTKKKGLKKGSKKKLKKTGKKKSPSSSAPSKLLQILAKDPEAWAYTRTRLLGLVSGDIDDAARGRILDVLVRDTDKRSVDYFIKQLKADASKVSWSQTLYLTERKLKVAYKVVKNRMAEHPSPKLTHAAAILAFHGNDSGREILESVGSYVGNPKTQDMVLAAAAGLWALGDKATWESVSEDVADMVAEPLEMRPRLKKEGALLARALFYAQVIEGKSISLAYPEQSVNVFIKKMGMEMKDSEAVEKNIERLTGGR